MTLCAFCGKSCLNGFRHTWNPLVFQGQEISLHRRCEQDFLNALVWERLQKRSRGESGRGHKAGGAA